MDSYKQESVKLQYSLINASEKYVQGTESTEE